MNIKNSKQVLVLVNTNLRQQTAVLSFSFPTLTGQFRNESGAQPIQGIRPQTPVPILQVSNVIGPRPLTN